MNFQNLADAHNLDPLMLYYTSGHPKAYKKLRTNCPGGNWSALNSIMVPHHTATFERPHCWVKEFRKGCYHVFLVMWLPHGILGAKTEVNQNFSNHYVALFMKCSCSIVALEFISSQTTYFSNKFFMRNHCSTLEAFLESRVNTHWGTKRICGLRLFYVKSVHS